MNEARIAAAASAAGGRIEAIGGTWMLHPEQLEASTQAGYPHPFAGYAAGRGGVLGDVPAGVVDAVFAVFEPTLLAQLWEGGVAVHGARGSAELYYRQCAEWGRAHLADVAGLDRFVELGERVIEAAPTLGLPLFSGWKAMARVSDTPGRAMQVVHVLRELRGGVHLAALAVSGLTPAQAHMLSHGGSAEYCAMFGWPEPYPDVAHLKAVRDELEEQTNTRMAAIVGSALSADEAEELAHLAEDIQAGACV